MSTLKNDLALFNELAEVLINEEQQNPVAERIEANQLYDTIDLSLSNDAMIDDQFKSVLSDILVTTPKTATNLFFNRIRSPILKNDATLSFSIFTSTLPVVFLWSI